MSEAFEVRAATNEVTSVLRSGLTPEEYGHVVVTSAHAPASDPFSVDRRHDLPDVRTIVEFTTGAVASGVLYDVIKKVAVLLERAFSGRVKKNDDKS
jgi:hypothetical protein